MKKKILPLAVFAACILLWQVVCEKGWVSPIFLPSPPDIAKYLIASVLDGSLPTALGVTMGRLLAGYALGIVFGVSLGFLLYRYSLAKSTLGVLALGLQTLPSVCWAPLSLLWFGQSESAMYFVVVMGSLWAIAIATENAISSVPRIYVRAARVMGSKGAHTWRTVIFPAALPQLVGGAKLGWAFSWRSLMAAEIYVTIITRMGIGQLLHFSRELHAMDQAMGIMLVIVTVGFLVDRMIFLPIEKRMRRNRGV